MAITPEIGLRKINRRVLFFDSNFECGNLQRAVWRAESEYDLYINSDTNSANRCQWFYFSVRNTRRGETVKFNVMNQTKFPHFYKQGMTPLVFSETDYSRIYMSWSAKTENVSLIKVARPVPTTSRPVALPSSSAEDEVRSTPSKVRKDDDYYVLSFTHTFKYDEDTVYFAFLKPYACSRLRTLILRTEAALGKKEASPKKGRRRPAEFELRAHGVLYRREVLGLSLGKVPVDLITITEDTQETATKTYIVITARVHAAETAGSYKVQGVLRFLLSANPCAVALRRKHIFLIVPMINVDGVIMGNNRCSLAGVDLNRCWGSPSRRFHPTVYRLKSLLTKLCTVGKRQILLFCDLHGHSKLLNSFVYACHQETSGTLCSWTQSRLLSRLLAKRCHLVDFHQCSFRVEPQKVLLLSEVHP